MAPYVTIRSLRRFAACDRTERASKRSPRAAYDRRMPRALCLDPGLGTFGAALVDEVARVLDIDACQTKVGEEVAATRALKRAARKAGKKSVSRGRGMKNATVEQFEDRHRRTSELFVWLDDFALGTDGIVPSVVVAEAGRMMGDAGADGIISLAVGSTVASLFAARFAIPIVWTTQLEWRRVLCPRPESGRLGDWTQAEIVAGVGPEVEALAKERLRMRGKSITLRDHAIDAAGMGKWAVRCSLAAMSALGLS